MLSKDELKAAILGANDLTIETLTVPEWDGVEVCIRVISGADRDWFEQMVSAATTNGTFVKNFRATLVALALCDDKGERVFGNKDIGVLGERSANGLNRVFEFAQALNGIAPDSVEDAEKNSDSVAG